VDETPITVVTGFLGAGKTTLLDRWLRAYGPGQVAVIVNELGAVGIDGELLRARVETLLEITGGCVCCTTYDELLRALSQLARSAPKRIVIETSGAASPAGVVRAIQATEDVRLDGIVTVVDAAAPEVAAPARDLAAEQLGYADVIVLAHRDRVDEAALAVAQARVARANPAAVIATAARGVLDGHGDLEALLAARREETLRMLPVAVAHTGIESVVLSIEGELDEDRFGDWVERDLGAVAGRLLRVKGIVAIAGVDQRAILQGIADRIEVSVGTAWGPEPRTSRMVIIGFGFDRAGLARGFEACAADRL
jgi:G3E family GTPase